MFLWMKEEANKLKLSENACAGAIILDEMSIQEDLSLVSKGVDSCYSGQVCVTPFCDLLVERRKGKVFPAIKLHPIGSYTKKTNYRYYCINSSLIT